MTRLFNDDEVRRGEEEKGDKERRNREEKEDRTDDRKMKEGEGERERERERERQNTKDALREHGNASDIFQHRRYVTLLVQTHRPQSGTAAQCEAASGKPIRIRLVFYNTYTRDLPVPPDLCTLPGDQ